MSIVLLHNLDDEGVLVNLANVNAATRKYPDADASVKEPFTKLFYVHRDKGMEGIGFPDAVKETPEEIFALVNK
jgi:hypothetical protein